MLDPKLGDLIMIRIIKVRMGKQKRNESLFFSSSRSEPSATDCQIDGEVLKQFQPNESGNRVRGTGNDSWYGKIEIDR